MIITHSFKIINNLTLFREIKPPLLPNRQKRVLNHITAGTKSAPKSSIKLSTKITSGKIRTTKDHVLQPFRLNVLDKTTPTTQSKGIINDITQNVSINPMKSGLFASIVLSDAIVKNKLISESGMYAIHKAILNNL